MRMLTTALVMTLALLAAIAAPAGAEKPPQIEAGTTFPDVNPCTGEPELVTLSWVITVHENRRNTVLTFETTVETTSGFAGTGTETQVMTADKLINTLNIRLTDGNQVSMVKGHRMIDLETGEVVMNTFRARCLGR